MMILIAYLHQGIIKHYMFYNCLLAPATVSLLSPFPGADSGGGAHPAHAPPPLKLEKNMIFWRKIVIFHTKYPKNFHASLCIWKKSDFFGAKSWFFTRNTPKFFAPPFARRNFFKCTPPNMKSLIRPCFLFTKFDNFNCWDIFTCLRMHTAH